MYDDVCNRCRRRAGSAGPNSRVVIELDRDRRYRRWLVWTLAQQCESRSVVSRHRSQVTRRRRDAGAAWAQPWRLRLLHRCGCTPLRRTPKRGVAYAPIAQGSCSPVVMRSMPQRAPPSVMRSAVRPRSSWPRPSVWSWRSATATAVRIPETNAYRSIGRTARTTLCSSSPRRFAMARTASVRFPPPPSRRRQR
jgi:hypothetical protein